jgi:hypothetical protein
MKKNKKYQDGGALFLTMPNGGGVPSMPVMSGQLPQYQIGSGIIQRTKDNFNHYYGKNYPFMQDGGDMEDESGATDNFYTNKVNGFIDRVRGVAQKNLESNLLKEAMRAMRGDDETVDYSQQEIEMAAYGMTTGQNQMQNTYDPSSLKIFASAYEKAKPFTQSLQDFAKMNRIITPNQKYTKEKTKWGLGFLDKFKEDNPWINSDGNPVNYTKASFDDGGTLIPIFQGDEGPSTANMSTEEFNKYMEEKRKADAERFGSNTTTGSNTTNDNVTANNTAVNTAGSNKGFQAGDVVKADGSVWRNGVMVSDGKGTIFENNPAPNSFEGYTWHTDANGNTYIVNPKGQLYSPYTPNASSVYTPNYYTPYDVYDRNANNGTYNFVERNQFTPGFRKAMQSGALDDAALLGALPHIKYRKALFPKNRNKEIKEISWQYGKLSGDPFAGQGNVPAPGTSTQTGTGTTTTAGNTGVTPPPIDSPAIQSAYDWTFRPGQGNFPPSGGWQDYPGTMEKPQVGPVNKDEFAPEAPFQSGYVPGSPEYPNVPGYGTQQKLPSGFNKKGVNEYDFATIDVVKNKYDKLWGAAKTPDEQAKVIADYWYNQYKNDLGNGTSTMRNFIAGDNDPLYNQLLEKAKSALNPGSAPSGTPSQSSGSNIPSWDQGRMQNMIGQNEKDYFATTQPDIFNKDWRDQNIVSDNGIYSNNMPKAWDTNLSKAGKKAIMDSYNDMPAPLKDMAGDQIFNSGYDPRQFMLAAAGVDKGYTGKGQPVYSNFEYRKWLRENTDKLWSENKDLIKQQYNDDPQAFTSSLTDYRKVLYGNIDSQNITAGPLTGMKTPGLQYNAWSGRSDATQDYIDQTYFDPNTGYVAPKYFQKTGGSLGKFIKKYQGDIGSNEVGSSAIDFTNFIDDEALANMGPIDPDTGMPVQPKAKTEQELAMERIRAVDAGTEYDQKDKPNTWFIEDPFWKKTKFKDKTKRDPWKAIRNINLATGFFNLDETKRAKDQTLKASQASELFADVDNSWGQYHPLTGKYMGPRGAEPPVINTGFAQMGGSMYNNLKQGDEIYLTQSQIDELLKRGVKLSYLE